MTGALHRLGLGALLFTSALAHGESIESSEGSEGSDEDDAPPLSVYGFARLDVLADDSRMSDLIAPHYVLPERAGGALNGEMTMTPRLSRFGLSIDEWDLASDISGQGALEVDFGGGGGLNAIRLRQAYVQLNLPGRFRLLAGQTADLISPLMPSVQIDTQMMFAGNTGERRPQFRISLDEKRFRFAVAAAAAGVIAPDPLAPDGGEREGLGSTQPAFQGLAEWKEPTRRGDIRMGIWGHVARDTLADGRSHRAQAMGIHVAAPVGPVGAVRGELYVGENAADIGGGIGQGVNMTAGTPIRAVGGWFEVELLPTSRHGLALGLSVDSAHEDDLNAGDRLRNQTSYAGLRYRPRSSFQLGLEYLHWRTQYVAMAPGVANRFNMHLSIFF